MRETTMISKRRIAAIATAAAAVVAMTTTSAGAVEPTGREFADHVRMMAQSDMGLDGTHNPGMHQGFSGMEHHHSS
ncbi:hypothetical protein H5392_09720 [Tessaracoccus sp. MC1865]|uniref:hypothetical protein n=1 Tax=Tessaracoccus sp. MC1865 TaxID=2760310 RepID=UPI001601C9E5|nr:hypothetical protein [Tessaracoccus sp. MC1865]MBB1484135.1 hypothetical protein [Tessaracoccus sp. MC1865]QTO37162.1 hypothetical protein J7D54_12085 [Tessaracoccus sp. MC1865]